MRAYEDETTIGAIVDALAPDGLHVERCLPKASLRGSSVDLRAVVVAGRAPNDRPHSLTGWTGTTITNPHRQRPNLSQPCHQPVRSARLAPGVDRLREARRFGLDRSVQASIRPTVFRNDHLYFQSAGGARLRGGLAPVCLGYCPDDRQTKAAAAG